MTLLVMGAGGHAREVLDVLEAAAGGPAAVESTSLYAEPGATSAAAADLVRARGYRLLDHIPEDATHYLPAVGDPGLRRHFAEVAEGAGLAPGRAVSPLAAVPPSLSDVPGLVCFAGTLVSTNVTLGRHCHLNLGCRISHDVRIGDFATVSPGVLLTGAVTVEDGVFLGAGAVVLPGRRIGRGAVVGAGAVVVRDVCPGSTVAGNPARPLRVR